MKLNITTLVAVVAAAVLACSAMAAEPTHITPTQIGAVGIGMTKDAVVYRYGNGLAFSCQTEACRAKYQYDSLTYNVPGGMLGVDIGTHYGYNNRVIEVWTNSPNFTLADGTHVGSAIPLGSCKVVAGKCIHHWHGFTLGHDPTVGELVWFKITHNILTEVAMDQGHVYSVHLLLCSKAAACYEWKPA